MRHPDWQTRFLEEIENWRDATFEWGKADCVHFVGAFVEAITGRDELGTWSYDSAASAAKALGDAGYTSLYDALVHRFGEPVPATYAQRGDVVYRDTTLELGAVGICVGGEAIFMIESKGSPWQRRILFECDYAFRVR